MDERIPQIITRKTQAKAQHEADGVLAGQRNYFLDMTFNIVLIYNAPINVNPQGGGGLGICGVFDHQLHPHPGDFD